MHTYIPREECATRACKENERAIALPTKRPRNDQLAMHVRVGTTRCRPVALGLPLQGQQE